jgi:hypothetical protein
MARPPRLSGSQWRAGLRYKPLQNGLLAERPCSAKNCNRFAMNYIFMGPHSTICINDCGYFNFNNCLFFPEGPQFFLCHVDREKGLRLSAVKLS